MGNNRIQVSPGVTIYLRFKTWWVVGAQGPFDSSNCPERSIRHCERTRFLDHEADRFWILTHGPAVGKGRDF